MSKLVWDQTGNRTYETGVDHVVLYPQAANGKYPKGVAWSGVSNISENPSGAESSPIYADNIKYLNLVSVEELGLSIEAYTYPDEWEECDGSAEVAPGVMIGQQDRKSFGLSYRTVLGNDTDGNSHGYKLHLIYGGKASPSEKGYDSINDSPVAIAFSWEVNTTPVSVNGFKPTASLVIDSTKVSSEKMADLEELLYGTTTDEAELPLPDEVIALLQTTVPTPGDGG